MQLKSMTKLYRALSNLEDLVGNLEENVLLGQDTFEGIKENLDKAIMATQKEYLEKKENPSKKFRILFMGEAFFEADSRADLTRVLDTLTVNAIDSTKALMIRAKINTSNMKIEEI